MAEWLDLAQATELLGAPEETVTRWVRQGLLACRGSLPYVRFERRVLEEWAREQGLGRRSQASRASAYEDDLLAGALERGAIGTARAADAAEAIQLALEQVQTLPEDARADLLQEVLGRERMASTALGHGVALPHPRRPPGRWVDQPHVSLLLLEEPVDWASLDGSGVDVVFLLLSPSVSVHLELLARVSLVLHDPSTRALLKPGASPEHLLAALQEVRREG